MNNFENYGRARKRKQGMQQITYIIFPTDWLHRLENKNLGKMEPWLTPALKILSLNLPQQKTKSTSNENDELKLDSTAHEIGQPEGRGISQAISSFPTTSGLFPIF